MIKVLMIANEFPPIGGSGVQRSAKFVKYLSRFGIEPVVMTKKVKGALKDETLLKELPKGLKVYSLNAYDLLHHKGLLAFPLKAIGRLVMVPDAEILWATFNRKKALEIVDVEKIETIYTTSFPYSSHLLGHFIKKMRPQVNWVVDFRDEWTNNPYYVDMPWMKFRLPFEKRQEQKVCELCDYFITNTPYMLKNFLKDYPVLEGKSSFIPNGYDPDDFKPLDYTPKNNERFVMTYSGSLYGRRNLVEFFKALQKVLERGEVDLSKIEIRIVGNIAKEVLESFKTDYALGDSIVAYGYMAHQESIKKLYESDLLLLSMGSGKGLENFYSGKIFEYIRANRPILAIVPEHGAAASVIRETKTGIVVDSDNESGIEKAIRDYYKKWDSGKISHEPLWNAIENYSRIQQTKALAHIINQL